MMTVKISTMLQIVEEIEAERDKLRAFAIDALKDWPECGGPDGGWLQELAMDYGLLAAHAPKPTEACGETCKCVEYYTPEEWAAGIVCYRRTALLIGGV